MIRTRGPGGRSGALPDRRRVAELADAVARELAAVSRALDPAEGQRRVGGGHAVDEDAAGLQVPYEEVEFLRGAGPDVGAEPERGVVGDGHGLLDVGDRIDRGDRPE